MAYASRREREVRCPLEYGMKAFGGKWKPGIVYVLNVKGALRYSNLKREPVNVSDTVLSSALRELEVGGIVGRTQYGGGPRQGGVLPDGEGSHRHAHSADGLPVVEADADRRREPHTRPVPTPRTT
ncbi:helix-turn-helix domain-containing protein [Methanomassiliicoccaceae archaeon COG_1]|nr:helix-turn-helix domain-containing protein [Methanomassiliicoccaceae archaeon COG_1]